MSDPHPSAGRALDALIAQEIMGWRWIDYRWHLGDIKQLLWHDDMGVATERDDFDWLTSSRWLPWDMPCWSTQDAAAFQVWDKLLAAGWVLQLFEAPAPPNAEPNDFRITCTALPGTGVRGEWQMYGGATRAEAICYAALGVERQERAE